MTSWLVLRQQQLLSASHRSQMQPPKCAAGAAMHLHPALRSLLVLLVTSCSAHCCCHAAAAVELAQYLSDGIQGLQGLQELRLWLGSGAAARQAGALLLVAADRQLGGCRCVLLQEPEKALL